MWTFINFLLFGEDNEGHPCHKYQPVEKLINQLEWCRLGGQWSVWFKHLNSWLTCALKRYTFRWNHKPLREIIVAIKHSITETITRDLYEQTRRNSYDIHTNYTKNKRLAHWPLFDLLPLIPTVIVKTQQRTMQRISCEITLFVSWVNNTNIPFPGNFTSWWSKRFVWQRVRPDEHFELIDEDFHWYEPSG